MRRNYLAFLYVACAAVMVSVFAAQVAFAQGLRYQDANELEAEGPVNISPPPGMTIPDAIVSTLPDPMQVPPPDQDNKWNFRDFGAGATIFQSGIGENSPYLRQTLSGLTPNQSYDLYAVYWTDEDENWTIRTGLDSANMTLYSWTGDGGTFPVAGSTQGIAASPAVWTDPPPSTKEPTGTIFIERVADPLVMILGKAGTTTANGSGQIDVFVDDNPAAGGPRRTWFDGIAYVEAGTPVTVTATLDRNSGALSVTNNTSQALQIKSYQITHANSELAANPQSGTVNSLNWTTVSSSNPSWTVTSPTTPSEFATVLAENGNGTTITVPANGGSLSFGNVWNKSPLDQMLVYLTLADDRLAVLAPTYTGPAIVSGDLDGNGAINVNDFQSFLSGLHTTPMLTRLENYRRGELTNDGTINFADWLAFRAAYNAANGNGSFEAMLASVPEPTSGIIMVIMAALFCGVARPRGRFVGALLVIGTLPFISTSAFALDIKVDLDSMRTSGTATGGPIATQSGYFSWDLTNVTMDGTTTTIDGVTFEIFGLAGANQSRIRLTGTTPNGGGGPLNDLLADFVFNEGADARAIGLRITGLPVGNYNMQSWHHDFGVGTPEATQVEVRNQGGMADILATGVPWSANPIQFMFGVTAANQVKEVIFRESSTGNRARFNGFTLSDFTPPPPVELTLRVNTTTGSVRIVNQQTVPFDMSYYEIRSATGALNLGGWTSLDESEGGDLPTEGWDEAPNSTASLLSEVNLQSMTTFAPGNSVSLGNAFTLGGTQNLQFLYAGPTETVLRSGNISYVTGPDTLPGDYNNNGVVDAADYVVWRKTDGNNQNGYNLWRTNFGRTSGSGASLASSAAVPEPQGLMLLTVAAACFVGVRRTAR